MIFRNALACVGTKIAVKDADLFSLREKRQSPLVRAGGAPTVRRHGASPDIARLAIPRAAVSLALEALNNAVTHAQAAQIDVAVMSADDRLTVTIADDGVGFDTAGSHPGHIGQSTMAERATAIGATIRVMSAPGAGCTVTVSLPAPH